MSQHIERIRIYLPDALQSQLSRPPIEHWEAMLRWVRHEGSSQARQQVEQRFPDWRIVGAVCVGLSSHYSRRAYRLSETELPGETRNTGPLERSMIRTYRRQWFVDINVRLDDGRPRPVYEGDGAEAVRRAGRLD